MGTPVVLSAQLGAHLPEKLIRTALHNNETLESGHLVMFKLGTNKVYLPSSGYLVMESNYSASLAIQWLQPVTQRKWQVESGSRTRIASGIARNALTSSYPYHQFHRSLALLLNLQARNCKFVHIPLA